MNKFEQLLFENLFSTKVNLHYDQRGSFREILRTCDLPSVVPPFVQDSLSISKFGVLRGLHFQKSQWQLMTLINGKIKDILLDLRRDSTTFGEVLSIEMKEESVNQLIIPPGVAHGFQVLSDQAIVNYKSSVYYGATEQFGVSLNSPEIKKHWKSAEPIISERDSAFPLLQIFLAKNSDFV